MEDDSTDWASTNVPFIETFEEKLRCPVCREMLRRAPTITECGHTFCGECLGRHLNTEKTCPLCRSEIQRAKLRLNKIIEDLADDWSTLVRCQLMDKVPLPVPASQVPRSSSQEIEGPGGDCEASDVEGAKPKLLSLPALPEGYGLCPICTKPMPISEIEGKHIDGCLKRKTASDERTVLPRKKRAVFGAIEPQLEKITIPFYPGLSELKLRNLLKDSLLSTKGGKQRLIARHQEWVNIWNTNILSKNPRTPSELRHMMAQWDRSQERKGNTNLKELDGAEWIQQNKTSFDALVEHARKAKNTKKEGEDSIN